MGIFKNLFGKKKELPEFTDEQYEEDYKLKEKGLENVLGDMHNMVGHAIIPFSIGGAVDMYYFPNHIAGTGFATMELLDPNGNGPKTNRLGTYELVAFTNKPINNIEEVESPTAFNLIERRMCGILTMVGKFSFQAILNPNETCEVPSDGEENRCLIFSNYLPEGKEFKIGERKHHLLLCMEVFRSEMEFARSYGVEDLIEELKACGHYPYSDLDRDSVA